MFRAFVFSLALVGLFACSSGPVVKKQQYAKLKNHRTFEYNLPVVWKGIETALKDYKIADRDPSNVEVHELEKITERNIETDWIYSLSRDKYQSFMVNGSPRKQYLQMRYRHHVVAKKTIGGTDVFVNSDEEIERLNPNGTSAGYTSVAETDSSRANELLDRVNNAILSAAP